MEVLVQDDAAGYLARAAKCDGAHDSIVLATRRLLLNGLTIDCCPRCLLEYCRMAEACRVPYRIEPVLGEHVVDTYDGGR